MAMVDNSTTNETGNKRQWGKKTIKITRVLLSPLVAVSSSRTA
jgi:hypothetical protein